MGLVWCSSSSPLVSDLCGPELTGKGGQCGNCLSWTLTGIALHRATQHVQIAEILVIHGATQDYFPLAIKILIALLIKSEKKILRYYKKKFFIE